MKGKISRKESAHRRYIYFRRNRKRPLAVSSQKEKIKHGIEDPDDFVLSGRNLSFESGDYYGSGIPDRGRDGGHADPSDGKLLQQIRTMIYLIIWPVPVSEPY